MSPKRSREPRKESDGSHSKGPRAVMLSKDEVIRIRKSQLLRLGPVTSRKDWDRHEEALPDHNELPEPASREGRGASTGKQV